MKKVQSQVKELEKEQAELKKGASKGEKEKLFEGKISKITTEIKNAEEVLKRLNKEKNEKELSLEQTRKEVKELRAKIAAEEVKIEQENTAQLR